MKHWGGTGLADRLAASAAGLLGDGVSVAACGCDCAEPLHESEADAMRRARPSRRAEFAAGRTAARRAIAALGHANAPVPVGSEGCPIWPQGLTGSITHTGSVALAAVASGKAHAAIGIDLEPAEPLERDLWDIVCTDADRRWLITRPEAQRGVYAKLIFSAKEAVYKAQYPLSGALFGFERIDLAPDLEGGTFTATFVADTAPFHAGSRIDGRFALVEGHILTAVTLPRGVGLQSEKGAFA